jgi:hypothetical protein
MVPVSNASLLRAAPPDAAFPLRSTCAMKPPSPELRIKIATEPWEFEQIHQLNYRTFVEEIPQHAPSPEGRLVDRFHAENTYAIVVKGRKLVAMLALRHKRPFSLDSKVLDLAQLPHFAGVNRCVSMA